MPLSPLPVLSYNSLMTRLLRLLFLLPPTLVAIVAAWALSRRLKPVRLRPTNDSTPPIGASEIRPGIRRLIMSDLHLGAGDRLDDFDADRELTELLHAYTAADEPTELILAGDTFEFLQVRLPDLPDNEWSPYAAARRLETILQAHPALVRSLRRFLAAPANQVTILIGNHDFELHYASAKQMLRRALGVAPHDSRVRFGTTYEGDGIYLVHGNQYDRWNRFVHFDGICEPFEVVLGTRLIREAVNPLEDEPLAVATLIDNIKPISAIFWYALALPNLRNGAMRRLAARSLVLLFRVLLWNEHYTLAHTGIARRCVRRMTVQRGAAALATMIIRAVGLQRFASPGDDWATFRYEAERQVFRSVCALQRATVRGLAHVARDPRRGDVCLFICGHTHLAQAIALNDRQTYINVGTWTDVIIDIATSRRQEQRFPFLEITYPTAGAAPEWRFLVWRGANEPPESWREAQYSVSEHAEYPV